MIYRYSILKEVKTAWIVCVEKEGQTEVEPIARCNSQAIALTVKGLYEKAERNDNVIIE